MLNKETNICFHFWGPLCCQHLGGHREAFVPTFPSLLHHPSSTKSHLVPRSLILRHVARFFCVWNSEKNKLRTPLPFTSVKWIFRRVLFRESRGRVGGFNYAVRGQIWCILGIHRKTHWDTSPRDLWKSHWAGSILGTPEHGRRMCESWEATFKGLQLKGTWREANWKCFRYHISVPVLRHNVEKVESHFSVALIFH